jgi:rod shape-determining protein MreD
MSDFDHQLLNKPRRQGWFDRFHFVNLAIITLFAILSRVYLQRLIPNTSFLELPLLLTIYFSLSRRSPVASLLFGMVVGLIEDSLAPYRLNPIGMNGLCKTLVGYFAASVSLRFDVEHVLLRFVLSFLFYFFNTFLYWVMRRAMLAQNVPFDVMDTLIYGALNAAVAVPLFLMLDRLKLSRA